MYLRTASFHTYPRGWPYYPGSWLSYSKFKYRIEASDALRQGMQSTGIQTLVGPKWRPSYADIAIVWSWKQPRIIEDAQQANRLLIVMERGFLQPRFEWVSLALNGFNDRGYFPPGNDNGERWRRHFSHHLRPWQERKGYVLLIGQVPGDASLNGTNIISWAQSRTDMLRRAGHKVVYRPHPQADTATPDGAACSRRDLKSDLSGATFVVTYSSTTAVEAILEGVPACVEDAGSVAYPMASHHIDEPLRRPDRTQWCHDLAWRQWTLEELRDGSAWRHLMSSFYPL
ncbi:hypothetical protein LQT97_11035 [Brucella pseudogrignonensis]|uniref:hypothetical protein n=1 Tax=Brucella pseudogrignonensis TaxID=419475 RepID=UPI001E299294|nr:hypothetical protein [Brucella pseudogrignonensis]MCD4511773.1 hypothetical protein [Brucella pseudogrignonensis]